METINPIDIVKEIQQVIPKKVEKINNGGCAYFARFLYEEFRQLKLNVEIEIKGLRAMFGGYQHIYLVINGEAFDATDWLNSERRAMKHLEDDLGYEQLKKITHIDDFGSWNSEFGGPEARKKLRNEIRAYFKALKNRVVLNPPSC